METGLTQPFMNKAATAAVKKKAIFSAGKIALAAIITASFCAAGTASIFAGQRTRPDSRKAAFGAVLDGELVIFGGRGRNGAVLGDTWSFSLESSTWSKLHVGVCHGVRELEQDTIAEQQIAARRKERTGLESQSSSQEDPFVPSPRFNGCFFDDETGLTVFGGELAFKDRKAISNQAFTLANKRVARDYALKDVAGKAMRAANAGKTPDPEFLRYDAHRCWLPTFIGSRRDEFYRRSAPACSKMHGPPGDDRRELVGFGGKQTDMYVQHDLFFANSKDVEEVVVKHSQGESPPQLKGACGFAFHSSADGDGWKDVFGLFGGRRGGDYRAELYVLQEHARTEQLQWKCYGPRCGEADVKGGVKLAGTHPPTGERRLREGEAVEDDDEDDDVAFDESADAADEEGALHAAFRRGKGLLGLDDTFVAAEPVAAEFAANSIRGQQPAAEAAAVVKSAHAPGPGFTAPPPRNHHGCAYSERTGQAFVYGGRHGHSRKGPVPIRSDLWVLNLKDRTWSEATGSSGVRPAGRFLPVLALDDNDEVLLFGGQSNEYGKLNDVWRFRPGFGWEVIARAVKK